MKLAGDQCGYGDIDNKTACAAFSCETRLINPDAAAAALRSIIILPNTSAAV
jgi:hypothetical protein